MAVQSDARNMTHIGFQGTVLEPKVFYL